jgi:DNA-binding MarR family transcriptional regulator
VKNISPLMLPLILNKLRKRLDQTSLSSLKKYSLSKLHLLYLMLLFETEEGMTLKELSEHLGFDKANTSRAISQLIEKGYVQKIPQGDLALKYKIGLTSKGREIAEIIWGQIDEANVEIISVFTPEELQSLAQIAAKLWMYLQETESEQP